MVTGVTVVLHISMKVHFVDWILQYRLSSRSLKRFMCMDVYIGAPGCVVFNVSVIESLVPYRSV